MTRFDENGDPIPNVVTQQANEALPDAAAAQGDLDASGTAEQTNQRGNAFPQAQANHEAAQGDAIMVDIHHDANVDNAKEGFTIAGVRRPNETHNVDSLEAENENEAGNAAEDQIRQTVAQENDAVYRAALNYLGRDPFMNDPDSIHADANNDANNYADADDEMDVDDQESDGEYASDDEDSDYESVDSDENELGVDMKAILSRLPPDESDDEYDDDDVDDSDADDEAAKKKAPQDKGIIDLDEDAVIASLNGEDVDPDDSIHGFNLLLKRRRMKSATGAAPQQKKEPFDLFGHFATIPELTLELSKHLRYADLLNVYCVSKDFHAIVNGHISHAMKLCAAYNAPESAKVFLFRLYGSLCILDPVGRPFIAGGVNYGPRHVPSLRWLAMIYHREKTVRDILACMAREGHRMPKSMSMSLKKMWLTMDISTSARRVQLMHNEEFWTDQDLYNIQMFMLKLDMRFNDPIDGPGDDGLRRIMLGQRGLTPLKQLLKRERFTKAIQIVRVAVRYCYQVPPEERGLSIFGVPAAEVGKGHLEGWGAGIVHLYRPDELVMREAVRRNLGLDDHMMSMVLWGYVDPVTKKNIKVTEEEMYMSDDEEKELEKVLEETELKVLEQLAGLKELKMSPIGMAPLGPLAKQDDDEWETEDEDMPQESMQDDLADPAAIGPSGWRRNP